jgi:hypothetical protein
LKVEGLHGPQPNAFPREWLPEPLLPLAEFTEAEKGRVDPMHPAFSFALFFASITSVRLLIPVIDAVFVPK